MEHTCSGNIGGLCLACNPEYANEGGSQRAVPDSTRLDEFALMDKLATMLGIAGPVSQEERNTSSLYKRSVLRKAILELDRAWKFKLSGANHG